MAISTAGLHVLIWVLIYGGLLVAALGWSLLKSGNGWGAGVVVVGVMAAVAGLIGIWWRSRMPSKRRAGEENAASIDTTT